MVTKGIDEDGDRVIVYKLHIKYELMKNNDNKYTFIEGYNFKTTSSLLTTDGTEIKAITFEKLLEMGKENLKNNTKKDETIEFKPYTIEKAKAAAAAEEARKLNLKNLKVQIFTMTSINKK